MENKELKHKELLETSSVYVKQLTSKICSIEPLIELLNKRKELIAMSIEQLTEFESNERSILLLKTDNELANAHSKLSGLKQQYADNLTFASKILEEMDLKYEEVLANAKRMSIKNKTLKDAIDSMKDADFSNIDNKISYYLKFKEVTTNQTKKK